MPDKSQIIKLLNELADMMEFIGENKFKVGAYRNGAYAIRKVESDIEELIFQKKLDQVKGIGKGLQAVIYEFSGLGKSLQYEELRKQVPVGIGDLLKIKGLGPKKVQQLYKELSVSDLIQLEYAVKNNKLAGLKGFTDSLINSIPAEIDQIRRNKNFILLNKALESANSVISELGTLKSVIKAEITGDLRRGMEIISSVLLIVLVKNDIEFRKELGSKFNITEKNKSFVISDLIEIPVVINYYDSLPEYIKGMVVTTGSNGFINKVFGKKEISGKNEQEIFKNAGIPYVIPEMREEEFLALKKKKLKENSDLSLEEFKGLLHWHTTYSDGKDTLEAMLNEAVKLNFRYIAVCDHSKSAGYANGLKEERVLQQKEQLDKLIEKYSIKLFQGIESDILIDGKLDYPEEFLPNFNFIVASVHSRFNLEEKDMTARIIKAVENPYTDLLGHPSGRLLLSREPYKIDTEKIIDACAANSVAVEINSHPKRLDLDWRWIYHARDKGCLFSINADAHSISDISYLKYGVMIGRKAGLKNNEVINCFDTESFKKFLNRKVKRNL
ncbi:MAG: PHP domain-containing protein [Ignavibacteriaceae bacterium]|nr:PHP domain-containing protein [Ignavibacteriaceae bacterium]